MPSPMLKVNLVDKMGMYVRDLLICAWKISIFKQNFVELHSGLFYDF